MEKEAVFLKAEWRNLILANYEFDPAILARFLPPNTELDTYGNTHYVSLVGFLFKDTRLKGMIVPFHNTFEEINLRFYVRYNNNGKWKRGVVFMKEIVPKKLVALVANKIFGENYHACDTRHLWTEPRPGKISVEYMWKEKNQWNWIVAMGDSLTRYMQPGSEEEFICEHYWGYTADKKNNTLEYGVEHPQWRMHTVSHYDIHCDFGQVYGPEFECLNAQKPKSVFLADGSDIRVLEKRVLTPTLSH